MNFSFGFPQSFSMSPDTEKDDETKVTSPDFETIVSNHDLQNPVNRQCRWMDLSAEDYKRVVENPGQFCLLNVSGGGLYTQWYFYHTLAGEFVFIFRTFSNDDSFIFTWQYGKPDEI